ncbi:MAG TPA: TetR/AcrR family transcriptional regulator C-terminal domain-containing protein [Acidimicrobiales bacterium]
MSKKGRLEREAVLNAAIAIVTRDGVDGLTMRRLASSLEVDPAMLYRTYATKEELVDDVASHLLEGSLRPAPVIGTARKRLKVADLVLPPFRPLLRLPLVSQFVDAVEAPCRGREPWRVNLKSVAKGLHHQLTEKRHLLDLVRDRPESTTLVFEPVLPLMWSAGFSQSEATRACRLVELHVVASAARDTVGAASANGERARSNGDEFEFGLECLLRGLDASLRNHRR